MELGRNCFTVTWRIENYNFCFKKSDHFSSPSFGIDSLQNTSWKLKILPNSLVKREHVRFYVQKITGANADFRLDYEITFFAQDSSPLYTEYFYKNPSWASSNYLFIPHHKIYTKERNVFLPPKTLTIRCRMYKSKDPFTNSGKCFIRTRFQKERTSFILFAEKFSSLLPGENKTLSIMSFSTEKPLFTLNLSLPGNLCCKERVWIEIKPQEDYIKFCKCILFLLDSEGTKTECGRSEILYSGEEPQEWKIPLNFTKGYLMKKNTQILSNDTLTLKCEFSFSTGIEYEKIEESEFGNPSFMDENPTRKVPNALEDLTCLYREGVLCDVKLRTETETFSVHKSILCARSSVFKTMFTTDMREKTIDCVIIKDLEADTVRRMLKFLYSDKLEDLDWESAKSLYYAADKYNILALKCRCSDFLKSNLQPCNSCDLLLLSHRHQDEELKKAVHEYIAEHHEEIFHSDQWIILGKSNPILTSETFQNFYLRNWKQ